MIVITTNNGGKRQPERNAAAVFRAEVIDRSDDEDQPHRRDRRVSLGTPK